MPTHLKVSAVLPQDAASFFLERDSAAFRALVAKSMKLGSLNIVEGWRDGDGQTEVYKFVTKPDLDAYVPASLQKHFLKGSFQYVDIIRYDPRHIARSPYQLHVSSIPPILPDQATLEFTLTIEEVDPGRSCRQTLEGDLDVRIPVLGRLVERIIADSLHRVYSGIPAIVEQWLQVRQDLLKTPGGERVLVSGRPSNTGVPWINERMRCLFKERGAGGGGNPQWKTLAAQPAQACATICRTDREDQMAPQLQHPGSQPAVGAAAADLAPAVHAGGAAPAAPAGHAERAEQPTAGHPAPGALGVAARTIARQQPQRALDQVQEPVEVEGDLFFDPLSEWPWAEEDTQGLLTGRPQVLVVVKKGSMQAATTIQKAQEKGENNSCALVPMPMQADCRTGSAAEHHDDSEDNSRKREKDKLAPVFSFGSVATVKSGRKRRTGIGRKLLKAKDAAWHVWRGHKGYGGKATA